MERGVAVEIYRGRETLLGTYEDVKKGDTFRAVGRENPRHRALMDADVKATEVYIPSEMLPKLFGDKEYDSEGFMKCWTEVELFPSGFQIHVSAKGWGFGSVYFSFSHGEQKTLRTDTECMGEKTLTSMFRSAAPQLAKMALERDPDYRKTQELGSLDDDDAERQAKRDQEREEEMADMRSQIAAKTISAPPEDPHTDKTVVVENQVHSPVQDPTPEL